MAPPGAELMIAFVGIAVTPSPEAARDRIHAADIGAMAGAGPARLLLTGYDRVVARLRSVTKAIVGAAVNEGQRRWSDERAGRALHLTR